jgi:hypothetical protein
MYDRLSSRVARRSIEQRLITFELPKGRAKEADEAVPDNAISIQHDKAFELFGIDLNNDKITWREFKEAILARSGKANAATVLAHRCPLKRKAAVMGILRPLTLGLPHALLTLQEEDGGPGGQGGERRGRP